MRATPSLRLLLPLVLALAALPADANNCVSWRKLAPEARSERVEATISSHVKSHVSRRYTSENRAAIQSCLRKFAEQIADKFTAACDERPGGSAEYLDDIFDRYLLSCIQ